VATDGASAGSPSGNWPVFCGVHENTRSASSQTATIMTAPMIAAAMGKPNDAIVITHSGENTTPPMLAPL
jgi:hypothetical protein